VLQKGLRALGLPFGPESFVLRTESHLVQWELCKRGAGLCMMMQAAGDSEPAVQRVLPALCPSFKFVTWLTCHRELKTSRRIRIAFDVLAQLLTGQQ
jgi:DNA-binding transcriptional LysR family regulator